ncbi:MAG: JAB domain-containing protein [Myxococcota bacterium]
MTEKWWYSALGGPRHERRRLAVELSKHEVGAILGSSNVELQRLGLSARDVRRIRAIQRLVRRSHLERTAGPTLRSPEEAARTLVELVWGEPVETIAVAVLNVRYQVVFARPVHRGAIDECMADPREIFRPAVLARGTAIVVGHNHPSGDPLPSRSDIDLTERLFMVGRGLGIALLDHVVVGGVSSPRWTSMANEGLFGQDALTATKVG